MARGMQNLDTKMGEIQNVPLQPCYYDEDESRTSPSSVETDLTAGLVIRRLEPVVGTLLEAIRRYRTLVKRMHENTDAEDDGSQPEMIASLLKKEVRLVDELQNVLRKVGSVYSLSDKKVAECLLILVNYISFPLRAILRSTSLHWSSSAARDLHAVVHVQSNSFKCVERASSALVLLLDLIRPYSSVSIETKLDLLASCASALPTGEDMSEGLRADDSALEHCFFRLLAAMESILQRQNDDKETFVKLIPVKLNGGILTRVVNCLAAIIEPTPRTGCDNDSWKRQSDRHMSKEILVQALVVLDMLVSQANDPSLWRVLFPFIFPSLYKRALQSLRISQLSSRVTVHAITTICQLLRTTWYRDHPNLSRGEEKSTDDIKEKLQSLALRSGKGPTRDSRLVASLSNAQAEHDNAFFRLADERLPGLLTVLIHMLSAARTPAVRLQATCLNDVVLGKVELNADTGAPAELLTTAFESCLILSQDEDDEVKSAATNVLKEYRSGSSRGRGRDVTMFVGPRVLYLTEELLPLSQGKRIPEMKSSLKLICAYLQLDSLQTVSRKNLRLFLAEEKTMHTIKDVLAKLLDKRFDSSWTSQGYDHEPVLQDNKVELPSPSLQYLGTETLNLVQTTVQSLAGVLGSKHTCLLIDACIADLYEGYLLRIRQGLSLTGPSQLNWVHSWMGIIKFSTHLLSGGFSPESNFNAKARHRKYLKSLACSAIPLITCYPLWKLPVAGSHATGGRLPVTPLVFLANEEMTVCLLDLLDLMLEALGDDAIDLLATVLYPVVEKAASDVSRISDRAMSVLRRISQLTACQDLGALFTENFGPLTSSMLSQLRIPGGQPVSTTNINDMHGDVLEVARVASLVFHTVGQKNRESSSDAMGSRKDECFIFSCMDELCRKLMQLFDHLSTGTVSEESVALIFLRLFDAAADILTCMSIREDMTPKLAEEQLYEVLESFRINRAAKGFTEHHERKSGELSNSSCEEDMDASLSRQATSLAGDVMTRCGYLLSHNSIFVQVLSCEVLSRLFRYLGQVSLAIPVGESSDGPETAVFRRIHDLWPSISSKLKALSDQVTASDQVSLILVESPRLLVDGSTNTGLKRVNLSKLLGLCAAMAECSNDFMAFRFRGDVWPCVGKILTRYLKIFAVDAGAREAMLSKSEQDLLLALIACLGRYFAHRPTGVVLTDLVPSVGALLFPFLHSGSDEIVKVCIDTIQHLLQVDRDSLWRQLVALSEKGFPPCPLRVSSDAMATTSTQEAGCGRLVADLLLSFADELPETPIL